MTYRCLNFDNYALKTLYLADMMKIKDWRNAQMNVLRQNVVLTDETQENYYLNIIVPSYQAKEPQILVFGFRFHDYLIGYGGLTNIDWKSKRAEVSFLIDTARTINIEQYCIDFEMFLKIIKSFAFIELKINRLFTETYANRPFHVEVLERNGFKHEGRLKQHVYIDGIFIDSLIHGCLKECKDV